MRISQSFLFSTSSAAYGGARQPQKELNVPFQMLLPLKLKKTVSGKSDKTKEAVCMQEMAVMFACFKKGEFDQKKCLKEISEFQNCFKDYSAKTALIKEQERKGILTPGEKKMTHRQMNLLLKAFPPKG